MMALHNNDETTEEPMGWWDTNKKGESFAKEPHAEMVWGDAPADILDDAILKIVKVFEENVGRKPTVDELVAGVLFSAPVILEED